MGTQTSTTLRAADGFRRVDAFERPATFVTKDREIYLLDVQANDAPAPCFTLSNSSSDASDIAVMHQGSGFFVGFKKTFYRFSNDGQLREEIELEQICKDVPRGREVEGFEEVPPEQINWRIEVSEGNRQLFFTWLTNGSDRAHVGRLDLEDRRVDWLPVRFGHGTAFDTRQSVVYEAWAYEGRGIYVSRFETPTEPPQHWPTRGDYDNIEWSPEFDRLLASTGSLNASPPPLAVIDTCSGIERVLEFTGTDAAWGADGRIWFHARPNNLSMAVNPDAQPERILWSTAETDGGFHSPPVLAPNGEWLAWSFVDADEPRVVLLDTVTRSYRILDDYWHSCAWLV